MLYEEYPNYRLSFYMKLQCVKIVNDKLTNIIQKESASNTVSFGAIKQKKKKQNKTKQNKIKKETTGKTTTIKTIVLKQMRLLFRQDLSTFSWSFLSKFVEGVVILYVILLLFGI